MNDHKISREKPSKNIVSRWSLTEKIFLEIGRRAKEEIYCGQQESLPQLAEFGLMQTNLHHIPPVRRVWKQRDEIWVFLNYLKREIALEDIYKESCGRKTMPFIKLSSFSQTGMAIVNLICLAKSLGHPEAVKPTCALSLDNQAALSQKKTLWDAGSCPWGWLVSRAEMLVLGGLTDPTCHTASATAYSPTPYSKPQAFSRWNQEPKLDHVPQESRRQDQGTIRVLSPCNSTEFMKLK